MIQYIDKAAVVAEIDRRISDNKKDIEHASHKNLEDYFEGYEDALALFKEKFLDTLEVKEVDLEKEITHYFKGWGNNEIHSFAMMQDGTSVGIDECIDIAKHFFELGLKTQKGE